MDRAIHGFFERFWINLALAIFFAMLSYVNIWQRRLWLRLLDVEESFWQRMGLPKGGMGRRFSESHFITISFIALVIAFLLLAIFNAWAYFYFLHRHSGR